jgi:hypothetical protein
VLHKDYDRKGSVEKKSLVVSLKGLGAKTNWLEVTRQSESNSGFDFELAVRFYTGGCEEKTLCVL